MADPYQVLGISSNATDDEVKNAYRQPVFQVPRTKAAGGGVIVYGAVQPPLGVVDGAHQVVPFPVPPLLGNALQKLLRQLARKYHPDNYVDNPLADLATEKMKEINEASGQQSQPLPIQLQQEEQQ